MESSFFSRFTGVFPKLPIITNLLLPIHSLQHPSASREESRPVSFWTPVKALPQTVILMLLFIVESCQTLLQPHGLQPTRLPCPWDFPDKNPGVGCHFLLQDILPNPGIEPVSPVLAGRHFFVFLNYWTIWEAPVILILGAKCLIGRHSWPFSNSASRTLDVFSK